jgi:uncharacterized coiled-coil protein SlyX
LSTIKSYHLHYYFCKIFVLTVSLFSKRSFLPKQEQELMVLSMGFCRALRPFSTYAIGNLPVHEKERCPMNPHYYYVPQQFYTEPYFDPFREPPQAQGIEKRVNALEQQNTQQIKELTRLSDELTRQNKEIHRLNGEISRLNQEVTRLNDVNMKQTRHLNRLNTRLRVVENRLTIPFTPTEGGF